MSCLSGEAKEKRCEELSEFEYDSKGSFDNCMGKDCVSDGRRWPGRSSKRRRRKSRRKSKRKSTKKKRRRKRKRTKKRRRKRRR